MLCYQVTNCTLPAFTFPAPVSYVPAAYSLTRRAGYDIPYAHSRSGIFMQKSYEVINVQRRNIYPSLIGNLKGPYETGIHKILH